MNYTETVRAKADPSRTWQAMADVLSYPQWTKSIMAVTALDGPTLAVGHRFQIRQPGFPAVVWRVTEFREGVGFSWETRALGLRSVGSHWLRGNADGTTQITLELRQTGALSGLMALFTGAKTRRFLALEAAGTRDAAES
jgi:hypothetical protein